MAEATYSVFDKDGNSLQLSSSALGNRLSASLAVLAGDFLVRLYAWYLPWFSRHDKFTVVEQLASMWQYFVPHCIYHLMRWFPKNNRIKIRVLLILSVLCIIGPQFYVLFNERSGRFCPFPLLSFLASSISFTFTMIGFSVLFALMDPVPSLVKIVFHVFGGGLFLYSIVQAIFTFQASECGTYSTELYWYSLADSVLSILSAAFFLLTVPFWVFNKVWKNSVLDREMRKGVCYEPVNCCSCIWHV